MLLWVCCVYFYGFTPQDIRYNFSASVCVCSFPSDMQVCCLQAQQYIHLVCRCLRQSNITAQTCTAVMRERIETLHLLKQTAKTNICCHGLGDIVFLFIYS